MIGDVARGTKRACLHRITPHECHHRFASTMGHADIAITMDRYGHLMPVNEAEAASLLDEYVVAATSKT